MKYSLNYIFTANWTRGHPSIKYVSSFYGRRCFWNWSRGQVSFFNLSQFFSNCQGSSLTKNGQATDPWDHQGQSCGLLPVDPVAGGSVHRRTRKALLREVVQPSQASFTRNKITTEFFSSLYHFGKTCQGKTGLVSTPLNSLCLQLNNIAHLILL